MPSENSNARFLVWATYKLGGFLGVAFVGIYVLEGLMLALCPVDVMSPTESRYLLFDGFRDAAPDALYARCMVYDIGCWLTDRKKLFAYALLCFWMVTFAQAVRGDDSARWRPTAAQRTALSTLVARSWMLPFWANVAIALPLTIFLGWAATNVFRKLNVDSTIIFRARPWALGSEAIYGNIYFVAYRLVYPALLFVCVLHLVIGSQCLFTLAMESRRTGRKTIDRFAWITILFVVVLSLLVGCVWAESSGPRDQQFYKDNALQLAFALVLVLLVVALLLMANVGSAMENPPALPKSLEFWEGLKLLPRYAWLPLLLAALPLAAVYLLLNVAGSLGAASLPEKQEPVLMSANKTLLKSEDLADYTEMLGQIRLRTDEEKLTDAWIKFDDDLRSWISKERLVPANRSPVAADVLKHWKQYYKQKFGSPYAPVAMRPLWLSASSESTNAESP